MLFDKGTSFIGHMPYLSTNISSSMFYGSMSLELLRIARCTIRLAHFVPKVPQLYDRMITQGGNKASILRQIKKHSKHFPSIVRHMTN